MCIFLGLFSDNYKDMELLKEAKLTYNYEQNENVT